MAKLRKTPDTELKRIKELEEQFLNKEETYKDKIKSLEDKIVKLKAEYHRERIATRIMEDSIPYASFLLFGLIITMWYKKTFIIWSVITALYLILAFISSKRFNIVSSDINSTISYIEAQIQLVNMELTSLYKSSNRCIPRHNLDKIEEIKSMLEKREVENIEQALKKLVKAEV